MPRNPTCGLLPKLRYEYLDDGTHSVKCACGAHVSTNVPLVAQRFVQTEIGKHARARIFTPLPDPELVLPDPF
jgi:hypothetical protein